MKHLRWNNSVGAFLVVAIGTAACAPATYTSARVPAVQRRSGASEPAPGSTQPQPAPVTNQPVSPTNSTTTPSTAVFGPTRAADVNISSGVPESDAIRKCVNLWGTVPFKVVKPENVKVMNVNIGIGGGLFGDKSPLSAIGNALNFGSTKDLESTTDPRLIIIPLSVNIGGSVTFELMNPNGWYCMKTAVGAKSNLNIKLNCTAKLAQSDLGISLDTKTNAGSPLPVKVGVNDGKAAGGQLGILIDSNSTISRVTSSGSTNCPP